MRCLYCDRQMGLFRQNKGSFCSEEHEALYHKAATRRLEDPYTPSAGTLEKWVAEGETATRTQAADLAQLLKVTQVDATSRVETPAPAESNVNAPVAAELVAQEVMKVHREGGGVAPPMNPPPSTRESDTRSDTIPQYVSDSRIPPQPKPPVAAPLEASDRRSEPRLEKLAILQVASFRNPERQQSCALVDISNGGIQFTADFDLSEGEIVVAELDSHVLLVEVKYSRVDGGKYAIGAEVVYSASRTSLPPANDKVAQAGMLVKGLCDQLQGGNTTTADREQSLERAARILEIWRKVESNPQQVHSSSPAEAEPAVEEAAEAEPAPAGPEIKVAQETSSSSKKTLAAVASGLALAGLLIIGYSQLRKPSEVTPPSDGAQQQPEASAGTGTPAKPAAQAQKAPAAKETQVAKSAAAKPAVAKPAAPKPEPAAKAASKPAPVVSAAKQPAVVPQVAKQVAKQQPAAAPKPPPPSPAAAAVTGQHRAQITALTSTWVGVSTDGRKVFGDLIPKGSTKEIQYSKYAFLHVGNAVGVAIVVDGQAVQMPNKPSLKLVELNTTGYKFVRWSNDDPPQP